MTVKIKISYQTPEELQKVLQKLGISTKNLKMVKQSGGYKRAYVVINDKTC